MRLRTLKSDLLLLLTAIIWGFSFVAQRVGMNYVGPFTFNGIRFALGSLSLLPLLYNNRRQADNSSAPPLKTVVIGGSANGVALFIGVTLQQIGIIYTTAGKAGFITGLYVVIVPILGMLWGQKTETGTWLGAILATVGLYLLSVTEQFTIVYGDLLVLIGAWFWAVHMHVIARFSRKIRPIKLAFLQFSVCSVLSLIAALFVEEITLHAIFQAGIPILYGGLCSVGIAYTLQVVAQRDAHPAHAAILLSLETVFAAFGGWIMLNEILSFRGIWGCGLMLAGMLVSQFRITANQFSRILNSLKKWTRFT